MKGNMMGNKKAAGSDERKCMVLTADYRLRSSVSTMLSDSDIVIYTPTDEHNASGYLFENYIDFLVIDVDRWGGDGNAYPGFTFAYKVREGLGYVRKPIIFLSRDDERRLYAYEHFNCINYILKPVDKSIFLPAVDKALTFSKNTFLKNPRYVKSDNTFFSFYYEEILYIDVYRCDVFFHKKDGKIIKANNSHLRCYMEDSKKVGFIQVRRDTMVNTRYIKNVDFNNKTLTLTDETKIFIGDKFKYNVLEHVRRYEINGRYTRT
jgi:DNA-binding LytR/AlgR family response regulator